ncbi:MAG: Dyp-type peroxidase [Alphaproteobacteria bacterium]
MIEQAQNGLLSDPTPHVEYLVFNIHKQPSDAQLATALGHISNTEKSIGQKDSDAHLTVTCGFSSSGWDQLFKNFPKPKELHDFIALKDGNREFPATQGDIFFMIKSTRIDLNYQVAKYLKTAFSSFAELIIDIQGFKYLDDRDMIDFVDGTENPKDKKRADAVLIKDDPEYVGGSYLVFQKYIDKHELWDALSTEEQEGVIGRTKFDDIEIDDDKKMPFAHNVKSKVVDETGEELKMLRQNRPFGNAMEHGTIFVGFAASVKVIEDSLKQMITADEDGNFDHLLKFVDATMGINFFIPPQSFFEKFDA